MMRDKYSTSILICSGLLVMLALSCNEQGPDQVNPDVKGFSQDERALFGAIAQAPATSVAFQPVHIGLNYDESVLYGELLDNDDPTKVDIRIRNLDAASSSWSEEHYILTASFKISHISSARSGRFYLLGSTPGGEHVIERWRKASVAGSGGGYVVKRTELYRGTSLGQIRVIEVDPLERYLLIIHMAGSAQLSRMSLPSGTPVLGLWDSSQIPNLEYVTKGYPRNHLTQGRLWVFSTFGADDPHIGVQERTILFDSQDDGILDSHLTLDEPTWEAMGYTQDVWDGEFGLDIGW